MQVSQSDSALHLPLLGQVTRESREQYFNFLKAYLSAEAPSIVGKSDLIAAHRRRTKALADRKVRPPIKNPFEGTSSPTAGKLFHDLGGRVITPQTKTEREPLREGFFSTHDECEQFRTRRERQANARRAQLRSTILLPALDGGTRPLDEIRALCASRQNPNQGTKAVFESMRAGQIEAFEAYPAHTTGIDKVKSSSNKLGAVMDTHKAMRSVKATEEAARKKKFRGNIVSLVRSVHLLRDIQCACESMRLAVFDSLEPGAGRKMGETGSISGNGKKHLESYMGTAKEVALLWRAWQEMDTDGGGSVSAKEVSKWLRMVGRNTDDPIKRRRIQIGEKCTLNLLAQSADGDYDADLGIGALMELIWPQAEESHIAGMKALIHFSETQRRRIRTPELLDSQHRAELVENFKNMDVEKRGYLCSRDLVNIGLHPEEVARMMKEFGENPEKGITLNEFITMMCPIDYLPYPEAKQCMTSQGRLIYDSGEYFSGWRLGDAKFKVAI